MLLQIIFIVFRYSIIEEYSFFVDIFYNKDEDKVMSRWCRGFDEDSLKLVECGKFCFEMEFVIISCSRGRSSVIMSALDIDTNVCYDISFSGIFETFQFIHTGQFQIIEKDLTYEGIKYYKTFKGIFTSEKHGSNYSINPYAGYFTS